MSRPRLLDLFCGAGGAGVGYHRAGFDVVGVDIAPQPNFPFEFHQADALEWAAAHGGDFDIIHASPPCQVHSALKRMHQGADYEARHIDMIEITRDLIKSFGVPYVIENVIGARGKLQNPILLCGAQFGLKVYRHRLFESNLFLFQPDHVPHQDKTPSSGRGASAKGFISVTGTGGVTRDGLPPGWNSAFEYMQFSMGIDWMTRAELSQSIPPAFTEYIGQQLIAGAFADYLADQGV